MAPYGRAVTLMGVPGDDADLNAYNLNLTLHNVMMLTPMWKGLEARLKEQAAIVRKVLGLVASQQLSIMLDKTFDLADAAAAHTHLETGKAIGKVTLRISYTREAICDWLAERHEDCPHQHREDPPPRSCGRLRISRFSTMA